MTTFLVPFDFSPEADCGLQYAVHLAYRAGTRLILLHVNESEEDADAYAREKTAVRLLAKCRGISGKYNIPVQYCNEKGKLLDIIQEVAGAKRADLVVMGSGGENTLEKVLLGSNTSAVISHAQVPVLMIPMGTVFRNIRRIVFATDFHSSDLDDLKGLARLAAVFGAQVDVLHIFREDMQDHWHREEMRKFMSEVQGQVDYNQLSFEMIEGNEVVERMKEYLDSGAADLLALTTHHRTYWSRLFGRSFADEVLYRSPVPVLVYHYRKDAAVKLF